MQKQVFLSFFQFKNSKNGHKKVILKTYVINVKNITKKIKFYQQDAVECVLMLIMTSCMSAMGTKSVFYKSKRLQLQV
jgi:hypothetical protein